MYIYTHIYIIYIIYNVFFSPTPSRSPLLPSHPTSCSFFSFYKKNPSKKIKTKMPKQNKKSTKKHMKFIFSDQLLLGIDLPWSVVDIPSDTLLKKIDFPLPTGINGK